MFGIETKTLVWAGAAALAATAIGVAACMWATEPKWDENKASKVIDDLLDAYNEAIAQYPHDRMKATFAFEQTASSMKQMFKESNSQFTDVHAWEVKFDAQVKHYRAALRKA